MNEAAWILQVSAQGEASLWLDVLSQQRGRFRCCYPLSARESHRERALLQPMLPLELQLRPSTTSNYIQSVDALAGPLSLSEPAWVAACYCNELLLKLLPIQQPAEALFAAYQRVLYQLANEFNAASLRQFEWALLVHLGFCPDLRQDAAGMRLQSQCYYRWAAEQGWLKAASGWTGRQIQQLAEQQFHQPDSARLSKALFRQLLGQLLAGRPLKSRQLWQQLQPKDRLGPLV